MPISLHELMYPLAQAYDSVVLRSDVEIGVQIKNLICYLAENYKKEYEMDKQIAIMLPILEGTDGKMKMSKSYDNYISI